MKNKHTLIGLFLLAAFTLNVQAEQSVKLVPEKTQLEQDQELLDQGIARTAQALHYTATVLKSQHDVIWRLPDARLLALLNANVPRTIALSQAKDKAATEVNTLLNLLNIAKLTTRAPVGLGRDDVQFDEQKKLFVIVPKPPVASPVVPNP